MLPLRDNIPNVRPSVVLWLLIGANILVFLHQLELSARESVYFLYTYGIVPVRLGDWEWALHYGLLPGGWDMLVTYMLLHGGWLHLLFNSWTLWMFGDNVEDVMGPWRFLAFYLLCGVAAGMLHLVFNLRSAVPIVGASGAIAGIMGAYFRFFPRAQVLTLIPIIIIPCFVELPVVLFLGLWLLIQVFSGITAFFAPSGRSSVAWWAHVGGFIAGIYMAPLFLRPGLKVAFFSRRPQPPVY